MGQQCVDWCREHGATVTDKVDFFHRFDGTEYRGAVALREIAEGECILRIPRALLIRPANPGCSEPQSEGHGAAQEKTCPVLRVFENGELKASPLIQVTGTRY